MPFEVPEGWVWCRLGDVISIKSGDSIRVRDNRQGEYPIYGGNGINGYYSDCNVEPDTIVIGRVGFYCGSVHQTISKAWVTDNAFIVSCESVFNSKYLCHLLEWLQLSKTSNSTAQPVISGKGIYPLLIPLPPLYEQERIVSEVKRCFTLIAQIEQGKSDLQTIIKQAKSKILDLAIHGKLVPQDPNDEPAIELLKRINPDFTPCDNGHSEKFPYDIPATWVWCGYNSILDISGGAQPSKSYFETTPRPNYVRLYQIRDYGESPVPIYIPINFASKQTEKGDILLARYGGSLGKVFHAEQGAYNVAMAKVIFKFDNLIYKEFAFYYYLSDLYQGKLKEISRTAQAGFNSTDFNDMYFPLPPLAEQQRIVSKIEELYSILDNIQKALEV